MAWTGHVEFELLTAAASTSSSVIINYAFSVIIECTPPRGLKAACQHAPICVHSKQTPRNCAVWFAPRQMPLKCLRALCRAGGLRQIVHSRANATPRLRVICELIDRCSLRVSQQLWCKLIQWIHRQTDLNLCIFELSYVRFREKKKPKMFQIDRLSQNLIRTSKFQICSSKVNPRTMQNQPRLFCLIHPLINECFHRLFSPIWPKAITRRAATTKHTH